MISHEDRYGNLQLISVTDTGLSHTKSGIENQDAVAYAFRSNDYFIAVSDGVGSCPLAATGSVAAVKASEQIFMRIESGELDPEEVHIPEQIIAEWKSSVENADDCCATLKLIIKCGNRLLLYSIGDGFLIVTSEGMTINAPQDNTLFVNQTQCLNASVSKEDFWVSEFILDTNVSYAVFLCTDGVANGIAEGMEIKLVQEIESSTTGDKLKSELEELVTDISDCSFDDRTVGVVKYERENGKSQR